MHSSHADIHLARFITTGAVFDKICSADLNGFLVRIPCDTQSVIHHEYGVEEWKDPNPKYNFHRDSKNFRDNGTWTKEEWGFGGNGEVYSIFDEDGKQLQGKKKRVKRRKISYRKAAKNIKP